MRQSLALVVCLVVLVPACNRRAAQNQRLHKEWNAKCKEIADLLVGVTDVRSAKAAEPKLKAALREMEKLNAQLDKNYDPEDVDPGDSPKMTKAVAEGIVEFQRLMTETMRIGMDPELTAALGETWKQLPTAAIIEANKKFPGRN
jgi:hypothetical protein